MAILGVDVGGTFTDAVLLEDGELRTAKVPTAARQEESVLAAAAAVGAAEVERFTHGTTVATNALLERKGARTAFVATAGFEHLLHLRRQNRAHLYRLCAAHPEPLVPLERCHGVRERIGPDGVLEPLELDSLPELAEDVEAVAVCLLFSFRDPSHERSVAEELRRRLPRARVVASHELSPELREYERASTTAIDAYLGPAVSGYLEALEGAAAAAGLPEPLVMRSSGGLATLAEAAAHPAVALVSGPAAGVVGAARVAGVEDAITLDMGGTSTDVCLIRGGQAGRSSEREVGGLPLRLPMVDLQTVGAGGGSIVWRDAGGALRVGPESAGADPGPACYGRGGTRPTVTDANLLLGQASRSPGRRARARPRCGRARLRRDRPGRGDRGRQRRDAARAAARLGRARSRSAGARARRLRRRGAAPRLRAGRGARDRDRGRAGGGRRPLGARPRDRRRAARLGALVRLPAGGGGRAAGTKARRSCATAASRSSWRCRCSDDLAEAFHRAHEARYGYADRDRPIELVAVRTADVRPGPALELPSGEPFETTGPGVLELEGATCWVPPGWVGVRDGTSSTLRLTRLSRDRADSVK